MRRSNTSTYMMKGYIADSLLLLMRSQPYESISIGEVTKRAGVNRSTYYRNFHSKDEVIMFVYNRIIEEYLTSIEASGEMPLQVYLEAMFTFFLKYKDSLMLIYHADVAHHILSALNSIFTADGVNLSVEEMFRIHYHTGGIYNTFLLWFDTGMSVSPKKLSAMSVSILPEGQRPMLKRSQNHVKAQRKTLEE